MKLDDVTVKKSVLAILSKLSRNERYKLHLHYKKFSNAEVARQNNPTKYKLSQENWEKLCDLFSDPKYKVRFLFIYIYQFRFCRIYFSYFSEQY